MSTNQPEWAGNATIENFSLRKNQLDEAIKLREEWLDDIEPDYWEGDDWEATEIAPFAGDARANSDGSGDHNYLHGFPSVVEEVADAYGFVREPEQDGDVVVNQGMSIVDALKEHFEGPLTGFTGTWRNMVYAAENEDENYDDGEPQLDKIIASNNGSQSFDATVFPAGKTSEAMPAGRITPQYASNPEEIISEGVEDEEEYLSKNIEYVTAIADQSVGRSFNTPDEIRNGELLINKQIEVNEAIDWDSVEQIHWRLKDVNKEDEPQITAEWAIDIEYEEGIGISKEAITDRETSMYSDGFEDLEAVQDIYEDNQVNLAEAVEAYREGVNAASKTTIEGLGSSAGYAAAGNPMAAGMKLATTPIRANTEFYNAMLGQDN